MESAPNLVLVGPTGAGKTAVGACLAPRLGLVFVDLDRALEARTGMAITALFAADGEAGFRTRERDLLGELLSGDGQLLATGAGAVLDPDNRALLQARGFVVHLHAAVDVQLERLAHDRARPLLQRPDRDAVLREMATVRAPLYDAVADLRLDTQGLSPAGAAARLQDLLRQAWQPATRGAARA